MNLRIFNQRRILFPLCQLPHTSQDWAVVAGVNSYHLARSDCVHCSPTLCSVTSLLQLETVGSLKPAVEGSIYTTEIGRCYKAGLVCSNCWLLTATAAAKSLQSCLTLCDPIDGSPPGSPVPGILQARTLEWVAISFSNAWKWKVKSLSRVQLLATPWTAAPPSMGFSRQEYWSGVSSPSPDGCWTLTRTQMGLGEPRTGTWTRSETTLSWSSWCSQKESN